MQLSEDKNRQETPAQHAATVPAYKLMPPLGSASLVIRTHVARHFERAAEARLVLLRAPAGFGKTTVMVQHHAELRQRGITTAWLSLDASDNDLVRFVAELAAAFQRIDAAIVPQRTANADIDGMALDLINRITLIDKPFVLFLDELEAIQNQAVLDVLRRVLASLPPGGAVVAGSRDIPELGLGKLRAHGHLLEIGPSELRFSLDETVSLMRDKRHLHLGDEEIAKLQRCTEGWAAALQLAALSLAGREDTRSFVATFSGSNADIADYLAEDVLLRQPPEVQEFLLKTSILQQLTPALCNAVAGRQDGREMLARLDRGNLFLLPLDGERRWYRYHSIFADFLRAQLAHSMPAAMPALHQRASAWYAEEGRPVPAIEHALASGIAGLALPLLDRHAEHLLWEGRVRLLARWLGTLSESGLRDYPKLRLIHAWALCLTHRYADAMTQLDALDARADAALQTQGMVVQTLALVMTDRMDACHESCMQIEPALASLDPFCYGVVANLTALCLISANEYGEARRLLDKAKHSHARLGATFNLAISDSIEGVIDLLQGRLRSASACLRGVYLRTQTMVSGTIGGRATVGVLLAVTLYEADEIDEAERLLNECLPFIRQTGTPDTVISSHLLLARIALYRGNRGAALQLLSELERIGHQASLPRVVASAWLERSRIALAEDDIAAAQEYFEHADMPEAWRLFPRFFMHANDVDMPAAVRARLLMLQGRAGEAIELLRQQIALAEQTQRLRRALKLTILLAQASAAAGDARQALQLMQEALRYASREGFVRTFLDEGPAVRKLVEEARQAMLREKRAIDEIPADFLERLLGAPDKDGAAQATTEAAQLLEALTEREAQVLQLLAEGHPNRVLADRLFVSETTIKAHLRNINTKLAARNRTDAVAIARRLGLIRD
jgi:LuxR family maltose regulon positive regulatory protein